MLEVKTKVDNFEKIIVNINKLSSHIYNRVMDELYRGGNDIRNAIQDSMYNTVKSGKRIRKGKKFHYPSAPGYPPAVDTGELVSRIHVELRRDKGEMEVGVIAGAPYGKILEEKKNRPFLQPAIDEEAPGIRKRIIDTIEKTINEMKR